MARRKKLFTIGYEQTPAKSVLDKLEQAGVKLLVAVGAQDSCGISSKPPYRHRPVIALDGDLPERHRVAAGITERLANR